MRNERWLPSLATIVRVGFLVAVGIRGDVGPHATHKNRAVIERVLTEQFTAAILENADARLVKDAEPAIDISLTPLMRLRIVKKKRKPLPMPFRAVRFNLFQLSAPTPDLSHRDGSIDLHGARRR